MTALPALSRRTCTVVACAVAVSLMVAGCATPPGGSATPGTGSTQDPCNMAATAATGAAVGALLGAITGNKRTATTGALIGGAVGALGCLAYNVQSRQTRTAAEVERDYERTRGVLPASPTLVAYAPVLRESVAQRGKPVHVQSTLELVNGTRDPVHDVSEKLVLFDQSGQPFKDASKPFTATSAGRFENTFEVRLPSNAPQGVYRMQAQVSVNGQPVATRMLQTQLVWDGRDARVIVAQAEPAR